MEQNENVNPFDEENIPMKMRIYAVSKKLEFNNTIYHFGVSVASHSVDPYDCEPLLNKILSTFKFTGK